MSGEEQCRGGTAPEAGGECWEVERAPTTQHKSGVTAIADELAGHGCCVDLFLRECLLALGELTNQELWKVLHTGSSSFLWVSPVLDKKTY